MLLLTNLLVSFPSLAAAVAILPYTTNKHTETGPNFSHDQLCPESEVSLISTKVPTTYSNSAGYVKATCTRTTKRTGYMEEMTSLQEHRSMGNNNYTQLYDPAYEYAEDISTTISYTESTTSSVSCSETSRIVLSSTFSVASSTLQLQSKLASVVPSVVLTSYPGAVYGVTSMDSSLVANPSTSSSFYLNVNKPTASAPEIDKYVAPSISDNGSIIPVIPTNTAPAANYEVLLISATPVEPVTSSTGSQHYAAYYAPTTLTAGQVEPSSIYIDKVDVD
jgi:hypothetical protein